MSIAFSFTIMLLVVPAIQTLPAENQPAVATTDNNQCALNLEASNENEIRGVFESSDMKITFQATKKYGKIHAHTTVTSKSGDKSIILVYLSLPNSKDRVVPGIEKLVVQHAMDLVESSNCQLPANLNVVHEELADELYQCTRELGMSQLRFSIMYLETVVASAQRICRGAKSICTPSPKYTYGEGLFMCEEDLEELYPDEIKSIKEKSLISEGNNLISEENNLISEGGNKKREKRLFINQCPLGLRGTDNGCCGYYSGRCVICSPICFYHDLLCRSCRFWHCFCEISGRQPRFF